MNKIQLIGQNLEELQLFCINNKYPKFHGDQLYRWIYRQSMQSTEAMSNIPKELKNIIKNKCNLNLLSIKKQLTSNTDNTNKFLLETIDKKLIECVSMIDKNRHTVCLSSQIGCNVDCDFCATGKMGIIRNLTAGEILNQLHIVNNNIKSHPITNIVFMGMGEPLLNYKNVIKASNIINDNNGFNISSKKITISTAGILPKIKQFIKEEQKYKLAISLNSAINEIRNQIMPINKKWPIDQIITTIKKYKFNKHRPIMFEYAIMKNINDSSEDAYAIIRLLKKTNCKINIIPYNYTYGQYKRPDDLTIQKFIKTLSDNNLKVFIRNSKGQDIDAACGQLVTKNAN
ncbi:MAG: 23S rRNA (adenine(2503)-C(2))-methyltransferase RlmN [Candidatus Marinimicrobia bacterium]|nr:23S rRNA (adenine(2503)-C(2))-methyltransferase RlmN [Candidatus Neomarinimicrobiota bacterium]|tara:strand:+ start:11206 stop:12237 length:1032 start_codon:yes stop_codon:yes gene_type:complete